MRSINAKEFIERNIDKFDYALIALVKHAIKIAEDEMRERAISSFDELVKWIYEHYSIHKELGDKELKAKFIELLDKTE